MQMRRHRFNVKERFVGGGTGEPLSAAPLYDFKWRLFVV